VALAWLWGQFQNDVLLVDADPQGDLSLLGTNELGPFPWTNVMLLGGLDGLERISFDGDIVVIDGLPLTKGAALRVLHNSDAAIICTRADASALETLPAAFARVRQAEMSSSRLRLLGIMVCALDEWEEDELEVVEQIREVHQTMLLEPAVPVQAAFRSWSVHPPTNGIPEGPAFQAYAQIGRTLYKDLEVPAYLPVVSVEASVTSPPPTRPEPDFEIIEVAPDDDDPTISPTFSGQLDSVVLLEMLQFLSHTRRSGCLRVATNQGPAEIELRDGEVLAATYGATSGFEALCALARGEGGFFELHETEQPCERNVELPSTMVVMELARFLDERGQPAE
jgi:cellulose biosynthesis protein BcsQ